MTGERDGRNRGGISSYKADGFPTRAISELAKFVEVRGWIRMDSDTRRQGLQRFERGRHFDGMGWVGLG